VGCSAGRRIIQATARGRAMYAGLDLHKKVGYGTIIDDRGLIVKRSKFPMSVDGVLSFLNGDPSSVRVAFEAGYRWQHLYDVLKDGGYDVTVVNSLMVKAVAYAKVKNDKVDSTTLDRLLRANMLPESYVPDKEVRELRDLVRRRHYLIYVKESLSR